MLTVALADPGRRETSKLGTKSAWFALLSNALAKGAVEGKDGYTILTMPVPAISNSHMALTDATEGTDGSIQAKKSRNFISWEFVGASVT